MIQQRTCMKFFEINWNCIVGVEVMAAGWDRLETLQSTAMYVMYMVFDVIVLGSEMSWY